MSFSDYVRYWLGSIHTYSSKTAPVILVASHSENVKEDPQSEVCGNSFSDLHILHTPSQTYFSLIHQDKVF